MPRNNPPRTIQAERPLARRIAWERDQRGWTNEGLAKRMADIGCPIQHTAIYKIEKGDPPRRVTVDEFVAFHRVFEVGLEDLLKPLAAVARRYTASMFEEWVDAHAALDQAMRQLMDARASIARTLKEYPEARNSVVDEMRIFIKDTYGYTEDEAVEMGMREFDPDRSNPINAAMLAGNRSAPED